MELTKVNYYYLKMSNIYLIFNLQTFTSLKQLNDLMKQTNYFD